MLGNAASPHTNRWAAWLAANGHEVALFSDEPARDHAIPRFAPEWSLVRKAVSFKLRGGPYANNRDKWQAYSRALRAWKPDLLHAHEALAYGPMLAHFPEFPRVLMPWGGDIESLRGGDAERAALVRGALHAADAVTANAPGLEEEWAALAGIERAALKLFAWGIDTALFTPVADDAAHAALRILGLNADERIILSPRTALPHYGTALILDAWGMLADDPLFARHVLVPVRGDADQGAWDDFRRRAGNRARVRLLDRRLDARELASLYTRAEAVLSIPERDLLALTVLEALACGAAPILSGLPILRRELRDAHVMFVDERTPAALAARVRATVARSPETRMQQAEHNRALVCARFDWARQAPRIGEVYDLARARHASRRRASR
jgi:glycosyltransferase involved in cell wall biosynthesis